LGVQTSTAQLSFAFFMGPPCGTVFSSALRDKILEITLIGEQSRTSSQGHGSRSRSRRVQGHSVWSRVVRFCFWELYFLVL